MAASMSSRAPSLWMQTWQQAWRQRVRAAPLRWAALSAVLLVISTAVLWSPNRRVGQAPLQAAHDADSSEEDSSGCPALPWVPWGCQHLRRACLDQGQAVLHGREYQPSQASVAHPVRPLPSWNPRTAENYPYLTDGGSNPDYLAAPGLLPPQPPLSFRPVSAAEPTSEMASPQVQ